MFVSSLFRALWVGAILWTVSGQRPSQGSRAVCWTCDQSPGCFECASKVNNGNGTSTVELDFSGCKGDDISWACCTGSTGPDEEFNAGECDVPDLGCFGKDDVASDPDGPKCETVSTMFVLVPSDAVSVTINTHDGAARNNAVPPIGADPVCAREPYQGGQCTTRDNLVTAHCLETINLATCPSDPPSFSPSGAPSKTPTKSPTIKPSDAPTTPPSAQPTPVPTKSPTIKPSSAPSVEPTTIPTKSPTVSPSNIPSAEPTLIPTKSPTVSPSNIPSAEPTTIPTKSPTVKPSSVPSAEPTLIPTKSPTVLPSNIPSAEPTLNPTKPPTVSPSAVPSTDPTVSPSHIPSTDPTIPPSNLPSEEPTLNPTEPPTVSPSAVPSTEPTLTPTQNPTRLPSSAPTDTPTTSPTASPTGICFNSPGDVCRERVDACDIEERCIEGDDSCPDCDDKFTGGFALKCGSNAFLCGIPDLASLGCNIGGSGVSTVVNLAYPDCLEDGTIEIDSDCERFDDGTASGGLGLSGYAVAICTDVGGSQFWTCTETDTPGDNASVTLIVETNPDACDDESGF